MTPHDQIQQQVKSIRERQGWATPGEWIARKTATSPRKGIFNSFARIDADTEGGNRSADLFVSVFPDRTADAEYIAAACSPEGGDLTRLLAVVEQMTGALQFYSTAWVTGCVGSTNGQPGNRLLADKGNKARNSLIQAAATLARKEGV